MEVSHSSLNTGTLPVNCYKIYLICMTDSISLRRGTSKLLEIVPNPFDLFNNKCIMCDTHMNARFIHMAEMFDPPME